MSAREAFNDLNDALETYRLELYDHYYSLHGIELKQKGDGILEQIDSVNGAIRALIKVNSEMEDAGIE